MFDDNEIDIEHSFLDQEYKISTLEEALEFAKKRNYTYTENEHLSVQQTEDGEIVAITVTNDDYQITKVLWEKDKEIK